MKKISKKQKLIILISIITVIVVIGIIIGANVIKVNILTGKYNTANKDSNNGNLLPEYIKAGITLGGVTGTLEDLDTSDATATPEDILYGKTAYVDGKKITGTYMTLGMLQVGDYVAYTPDTASNYSLSKTYSGYDTDQTISQEKLSWQILSINDDGTVDLISSVSTTATVGLADAVGYNNGVYLLNDISAKLYSNSKLGVTARSITIEDIEKHMTEEGLKNVHGYSGSSVPWGGTKTYTSNRYYPNLYPEENGSGINTTEVKTDGIEQSDSYYTSPKTETYSQADSNGLTVTQTYYNRTMSSNYYDNNIFYNFIHNIGSTYWLASRYVDTGTNNASFGILGVSDSGFGGYGLFNSNYNNFSYSKRLRPVVSLKSNIKLVGGNGEEGTPYQIAGQQ